MFSIFVITEDKFYLLYLKDRCYIMQYSDISTFAWNDCRFNNSFTKISVIFIILNKIIDS